MSCIVLPVFNFLVLSLVFWCGFGLGTGLTRKLEALFDGAEELAGHVVDVLQRRDDVGRACDGLYEVNQSRVEQNVF